MEFEAYVYRQATIGAVFLLGICFVAYFALRSLMTARPYFTRCPNCRKWVTFNSRLQKPTSGLKAKIECLKASHCGERDIEIRRLKDELCEIANTHIQPGLTEAEIALRRQISMLADVIEIYRSESKRQTEILNRAVVSMEAVAASLADACPTDLTPARSSPY